MAIVQSLKTGIHMPHSLAEANVKCRQVVAVAMAVGTVIVGAHWAEEQGHERGAENGTIYPLTPTPPVTTNTPLVFNKP